MKYIEMTPITRGGAAIALASGQPPLIADAALRLALFDPDAAFVEGVVFGLLAHSDHVVRVGAVRALSHLARLHRDLDANALRAALRSMMEDPLVTDVAQETLEDETPPW
jgi:hypothetical protein